MSSNILPSVGVHPSEEVLEEYSFGRIPEPALAALEEHLLICPVCQSQLLAVDDYKALMKSGIVRFERVREASVAHSPRFWFPRLPGGINVFLAAAVLLVVSTTVIAWRMYLTAAAVSPAATVRLIALRGDEADASASAPANRPLNLVIDRTDLPSSLSYRLEIVSSSGRQIWSGIARVADEAISAEAAARFESGVYWVRLYSGDRLLREFRLHIG
jgi:hypothetical protein